MGFTWPALNPGKPGSATDCPFISASNNGTNGARAETIVTSVACVIVTGPADSSNTPPSLTATEETIGPR